MNVGIVGLGKLGLPVAYAIASRGIDVYGYDPLVSGPSADCSHEQGLEEVIAAAGERMHFAPLEQVVDRCDVIFVAVQTPHDPRFEGITPIPEDRADFDYTYLRAAVEAVAAIAGGKETVTLAVISTVLPGTMAREIVPLLPRNARLVYNPSFIAMGTTIRDFLDPEFVLLGGDDGTVREVYDAAGITVDRSVPWEGAGAEGCDVEWASQVYETTVQNAELVKVSYNTFIGLKIAFANTLMEVCHKTGCDVDEVTGALKLAHRRLISPAYLDGGMGDGGGCHPRDNIALSWLARELGLSYDLFNAAMEARERQAVWLCDLMEGYDLPKGILGYAYKPGSHLITGSPALLVKHLLQGRGHSVYLHDPHAQSNGVFRREDPHVFLIGCKHSEFADLQIPEGSVVIDPFRYMPDQDGVEVVRLGQWEPAPTATSASTTRRLAA